MTQEQWTCPWCGQTPITNEHGINVLLGKQRVERLRRVAIDARLVVRQSELHHSPYLDLLERALEIAQEAGDLDPLPGERPPGPPNPPKVPNRPKEFA